MKAVKRILTALLAGAMLAAGALAFAACGNGKETITIWTSGEDYKNEFYLSSLKEKFPDYDISLEYMTSSGIAAKVTEEGEDCSCDIILSEEYGYLYKCEPYLAELTDFDYAPFLDELVPASHKFTPELKNGRRG